MISSLQSRAAGLLSRFYGYRSFRPGQWDVISAVASGRDAVVIMPTGGGKSICYQIPALLAEEGCAVVVSPLIALMQDQTQGLVANGIPAAALHSNQDENENRRITAAAAEGKIKLLYVSPERLLADMDIFKCIKISLFAIDEAHCISQWGHDFRPVYTELSQLKSIFKGVPVLALTATADRLTRNDIITQLHLEDPYCHLSSFDRPNISLAVYANPGARQRNAFIKDMAAKYPQDSGVVYCLSRKGAEETNAALSALGLRTVCYHAGMTPQARDKSLHAFLTGRAQIVCATVAFGMGIDKSNIRWVIHVNMPGNIESYYQEIGRAGRDGLPAEAVLFYSLQDVILRRNFAQESGQPVINTEKLSRMQEYAEARVCRRRILLSYFSEETTCDCGNCDNCRRPPARFDGTVTAQKALSAVMRTHASTGIRTIIGILRGYSRFDIKTAGYDRLPTFGVGADMTEEQWLDYITQMVQLGLLEIAYEDGNHLRPTALGMKVLRGQERLTLSVYTGTAEIRRKSKKDDGRKVPSDPVQQLFEQLKSVRADIARTENLPPYIVFSDATLLDMAKQKPTDTESLLRVSGVGEVKAVRYGKRFIREIRRFTGMSATERGSSIKETLILFNAGMTAREIASTKNIKESTVYSHFAELIGEGMITAFHRIIAADDFRAISAEFDRDPENAYERLRESYPPGLISVAKAIRTAVAAKKTGLDRK